MMLISKLVKGLSVKFVVLASSDPGQKERIAEATTALADRGDISTVFSPDALLDAGALIGVAFQLGGQRFEDAARACLYKALDLVAVDRTTPSTDRPARDVARDACAEILGLMHEKRHDEAHARLAALAAVLKKRAGMEAAVEVLGALAIEPPPARKKIEAIEAGASQETAMQQLGGAYQLLRQGQLEEARTIIERVLGREPGLLPALDLYALYHYESKRYPEAAAIYRKVVALDPGNGAHHYHLGNALRFGRNWMEAADAYDAALRLDPQNVAAMGNQALALEFLGHYERALALAERVDALEPEGGWGRLRGICLARLGRHADALAFLDAAVAGRDAVQDPDPHIERALCLEALGREPEAEAAFERAGAMSARAAYHAARRAETYWGRGAAERYAAAVQFLGIMRLEGALSFAEAGEERHARERLAALDPEQLRAMDRDVRARRERRAGKIAAREARDGQLALGQAIRAAHRNNAGDLAGALTGFDRALALDPRCSAAITGRLLVLANLGQVDEARAGVREVRATTGDDRCLADISKRLETSNSGRSGIGVLHEPAREVRASKDAASKLDDQGRLGEALAAYEEVLQLDPNFPDAWTDRGYVLRKLGRPDDALASYATALELDPTSFVAWVNQGNCLLASGRIQDAVASFDRALALKPDNVNLQATRENALRQLAGDAGAQVASLMNQVAHAKQSGRFEDALALCAKAAALAPGDETVHYNTANTYLALDRHQEALPHYDRTLAINPEHRQAQFNRAVCLELLGRLEESLAGFEEALRRDAGYAKAAEARVRVLAKLRGAPAPVPPSQAVMLTAIADKLCSAGNQAAALPLYDQAIAADPAFPGAWVNKAATLNDLERYDEAITCLDEAARLAPGSPVPLSTKAFSLMQLERHTEAAAVAARAVELDPGHAPAWMNKALAEDLAGRVEDAVRSYERFIELDDASMQPQIVTARRLLARLKATP